MKKEEIQKEYDLMKINRVHTHEKFRVGTNMSKDVDEYYKDNSTLFRNTKMGATEMDNESVKIEDIPRKRPEKNFESYEATYRNKTKKYTRKLKREM